MPIPDRLRDIIGKEHRLDHVSRTLRDYAVDLKPNVVGAYHLSCSDESERECLESFQNIFVQELLPELKYWSKSAFRTATLGARYETGAVAVAEEHFATPEAMNGFKLLVIKLNTHVSYCEDEDGVTFGKKSRYDKASVYCGALNLLLTGSELPFAKELTELFAADGTDRVALLRGMDEDTRALKAAIVASVLQCRRIVGDIQTFADNSPTKYLVVSAVTINREKPDTELICGLWEVDSRGDQDEVRYVGLTDDPRSYILDDEAGRLVVHRKAERA